MDDYGHLDDETPSLAISVYADDRGKQVGTSLLEVMLKSLQKQGYQHTSLSVPKENQAVHLYRRLRYHIVSETAEAYLMRYDFS